jgi:Kef-type K+ transport system membrane component KefB
VLLFVFVASSLEWSKVVAGLQLGLGLVAVRWVAKLLGVGLFAHISGTTWSKGLWLGLALTPISAFLILVLEQTPFLNVDLMDQVAPLAAATLLLEILGPILTQYALHWSSEVPSAKEY